MEKIIIEFSRIIKKMDKRSIGRNGSTTLNIIIPILSKRNVYLKDLEDNLIKVSSKKNFIYRDVFKNIYLIKSRFTDPVHDDKYIKHHYHMAKIEYYNDGIEARQYQLYVNNRPEKGEIT